MSYIFPYLYIVFCFEEDCRFVNSSVQALQIFIYCVTIY